MRFSVPEDAQGVSTFASHTGYLRKQADNEQGAWNTYYFALRPATFLYYYNTPTDDRPRGIIDMEYLRDVRYNVDCLQRCVGGSEHCFRVTGQMPKDVSSQHHSTDSKLKLRPLFLDSETSDDALAWMDALQAHRFSLEQAEDYAAMRERLDVAERALAQERDRAERAAATVARIQRTSRVLLNTLRGIDDSDDAVHRSYSTNTDVVATLDDIEALVDDCQAEAVQQSKVIATLRAREAQHEIKVRELTKLAATASSTGRAISAAADDSASILSADELSRMERVGAAKGRSTSDVRELFKKKTTLFMSKKPSAETVTTAAAAVPATLPTPALAPCVEETADDDHDVSEGGSETPGNGVMTGLVGALKKRVAPKTSSAPTETSRESDDTVSISSEASVESLGDRLPRGWAKRLSRSHPGAFFYVHTSGFTCWEIPSDFVADDGAVLDDVSDTTTTTTTAAAVAAPVSASDPVKAEPAPLRSLADVAVAAVDAASSADESKQQQLAAAKKPGKGWGFLKKFPLAKTVAAASATSPKDESPSSIPAFVEHEDGRHEF